MLTDISWFLLSEEKTNKIVTMLSILRSKDGDSVDTQRTWFLLSEEKRSKIIVVLSILRSKHGNSVDRHMS